MKKMLSALLMVMLVLLLCACGAQEEEKENNQKEINSQETTLAAKTEAETSEAGTEATQSKSADLTKPQTTEETTKAALKSAEDSKKLASAAGDYFIFATDIDGFCVSSESMGMAATMMLKKDGTGRLYLLNSEKEQIDGDIEWTLDGENITVTAEGESISGTLKDGIVTLDFNQEIIVYFAKEGVDTSSIEIMDADDIAEALAESVTGNGEGVPSDESGDANIISNEADAGSGVEIIGKTPRELADELGLYSDANHQVMDLYGVLIDYEHKGDKVTGCTAYVDALSDEGAKYTSENSYNSDPTIESVSNLGSIVAIKYKPEAYESLTVSALDLVFPNAKIEK